MFFEHMNSPATF
jgi:hypothetical protein